MNEVRLGIIGLGSQGRQYAQKILNEDVARCELKAVCDADPGNLAKFDENICKFADSTALIESGKVDAVLIATPHYSHTTIGIEALKHGLHVLVEKPISAHKADCECLLASNKGDKQVFAVWAKGIISRWKTR